MEPIPAILKQLVSPERHAAHRDFLAFLAERAPRDLAEQIADDGEPDLGLSKWVHLDDLMRPLVTLSFPDHGAMEVADILSYILIGYCQRFTGLPCQQ